jgi:hypothetical protein
LRQGSAAAADGFHVGYRQFIGYQGQLTGSPDNIRQTGCKTSFEFDTIRIALILAVYAVCSLTDFCHFSFFIPETLD